MKFILTITLSIYLLLSCLLTAHAKDEQIENKITLTIAIEPNGYFPYNYEEGSEIKGFTVDILKYFEENSSYNFEFIILPWERALYLVKQGNVDLILTFFKNSVREKNYHFIEPFYGYEVNQLFVLSDSSFEFTGSLKQLAPYSIGTKRGYSYGELFDQADYLTKLPTINEETLLKLLLSRQIDMAISNPYIFRRMALEQGAFDKVKALEPYVAKTPVYFGLTKTRQDSLKIKRILGELTTKLKTSSYYQELLDKYQLNFE